MVMYDVITCIVWIVAGNWLDVNYIRTIDLLIAFSIPLITLGSLTSLYLAIKRNKVYILSYLYNVLFLEECVLESATSTTTISSPYGVSSDKIGTMMFFLFLVTNFIPYVSLFIHQKTNKDNVRKT